MGEACGYRGELCLQLLGMSAYVNTKDLAAILAICLSLRVCCTLKCCFMISTRFVVTLDPGHCVQEQGSCFRRFKSEHDTLAKSCPNVMRPEWAVRRDKAIYGA